MVSQLERYLQQANIRSTNPKIKRRVGQLQKKIRVGNYVVGRKAKSIQVVMPKAKQSKYKYKTHIRNQLQKRKDDLAQERINKINDKIARIEERLGMPQGTIEFRDDGNFEYYEGLPDNYYFDELERNKQHHDWFDEWKGQIFDESGNLLGGEVTPYTIQEGTFYKEPTGWCAPPHIAEDNRKNVTKNMQYVAIAVGIGLLLLVIVGSRR